MDVGAVLVGQLLEVTTEIAICVGLRGHQFDDRPPDAVDARRARSDHQPRLCRVAAGGHYLDLAVLLSLHAADAAGAVWFRLLMEAERRDIDARLPGRLQDGHARPGAHLSAIELQDYRVSHISLHVSGQPWCPAQAVVAPARPKSSP